MMHSGKSPALKVFANNGGTPNPSSKDPSSGVGLTKQQPRAGKSENCDPNLSVGGKKKALQKVESSPGFGDNHRDDSGNDNGSILQLPEQSDPAGAAHLESAAGGLENHSEEVNRPASKLAFSAPRKAAPVSAHFECNATDELERQSKVVNRPASKSSIPSPSKAPVAAHSECDTTGELERQLKVANRPASKTSLPSPTKATAGAAHSECDAALEFGRQSKEIHGPATSKLSQITSPTKSSLIPSPTKTSLIPAPSKAPLVSHQHGHSPRPHHCRSPYCASNNPDYATKGQPAPRKYLVSKRHLVPGAICTKDPAVLASQSQETATPHAPSTGKPPKPSRKLENALRQPSFTTSVSERSTAPVSYECSPTRIPKPPSARSPGVLESTPLIDQLSSTVSHLIDPTAETETPSFATAWQDSASERSSNDGEFPQERLPESNVDESEHLSRVGSDLSCTVAVASASPRASDAGEASVVSTQLVSSSVISAGEPGIEELPVSPESLIQSIAELPAVTPASDQFSPEPEAPVFAATPSSSVPSSAELEVVTQRFAQKLSFETVEEPSVQVTECLPTEGVLSADGLEGRTEYEEGPSISRDRDAEEHSSNSDSRLRVPQENSDGGDIQVEENSDGEDSQAEENSDGGDSQAEENLVGGIHQARKTVDGEYLQFRNDVPVFDDTPSSDEMEGQTVPDGRPISSYIEELEYAQGEPTTEGQREVPKYVRGKGRQLWRSDCRDSREVVFLKQTPQADRRAGGDWMVNDVLEGAISRLNSCGKGRVRVLVEAFESMMNLGGDSDSSERRASRVWCLNRMEKGEVDEDGEEFEAGDQRVDCYEVSGDGLQLRASMRLSLGGGNRLPLYHSDEGDEIEMSAIQKVQEWDDDRRESQSLEDQDQDCGPLRSSQSQPDGDVLHDQETDSEGRSANTELTFANLQRRISFSGSHTVLGENDRSSEDSGCDAQTEDQFGCYTSDDGQQKADERSTFSLDLDCKYKASRRRRYWKARSANGEPAGPSSVGGGADKDRRGARGTMLEPFHLQTEERGMMKEYQFSKKLQQMLEEEERLRNPIAQGLPWTTDFPEVVPKPSVKEQTRPVEFRHYSNSRAIERADFDSYISERSVYMEMQRQEEERLRIQAEQEEIRRLRREMVPKAQLMPFFDQPFMPTRSSKRLTVPKEPTFLNRQHKRAKCIVWQQHHQHQPFTTQTYE